MYPSENLPVLFLVMEFAPVNTTGNFRSLKFIKYLAGFGINPIIVTFKKEEAAKYLKAKIDNRLLEEIPKGTALYRIHCKDGDKYYRNRLRSFITIFFSIKDNLAKRWKKNLFSELEIIIARHQPKLIFTTLPPFSSGMLAVKVSENFKLPLIVDMRDCWAMWGNKPFASKIHYWLTIFEERKIFNKASAVIGVTPQLINTFQKSHIEINKSKFYYIPNGFDKEPDYLNDFVFEPDKNKIVIGYVGSFYYSPQNRENIFKPWWKKRLHEFFQYVPVKEDWLYRSPYFFFRTIALLFDTYPEMKKKVFMEFVGNKPEWFDQMANEFGLSGNIKSYGFVPHETAIELQGNFDLVLATSEKVIEGEHYCLPSKTFDYISLNKPIVGFVTDGIQKEFILKSGSGIILNPDEPVDAVEQLMDLFNQGKKFKLNKEYLDSFKREALSKKLSNLFNEIAAVKSF
ncbi:MAG: glycosyltransferase [Panacibacter sp.]